MRHTLELIKLGAARTAIFAFLLSLSAALFEITAFVLMSLFVRVLEKGTLETFFGYTINLNRDHLQGVAISAIAFLIAAMIMTILTTIYITRSGRRYFDDLAERVFRKIQSRIAQGHMHSVAETASMIKYDSRYAAVAYLHCLRLIYPVFIIIGIFIAAYFQQPMLSLIIFGSVLVMIPFHLKLMMWGSETARRIRAGAAGRHEVIDRLIRNLFRHPHKDYGAQISPNVITKSDGNKYFMDAYVDRQRLPTFSYAISDMSIILAVMIIAYFLLQQETFEGEGFLSSLIVGLIAFRFLVRNLSQALQSVTAISSLQPFYIRVGMLINQSDEEPPALPLLGAAIRQPVRLAVITFNPYSAWSARAIASAVSGETNVSTFSTGFDLTSEDWQAELTVADTVLRNDLQAGSDAGVDTKEQAELAAFISADANSSVRSLWRKLSRPAQTFLQLGGNAELQPTLVMDGMDCLVLTNKQFDRLYERLSEQAIITIFNTPPRNIRLNDDFQIAVLTLDGIQIVGDQAEYQQLLPKISAMKPSEKGADALYSTEVFGE